MASIRDDFPLMDRFTAGFLIVHKDRTIRYINAAAERILSIRRENVVGRTCCDILQSDRNVPFCQLEQAVREKRPFTNYICVCCLNSPFYKNLYNIAMVPMEDERGEVQDVGVFFGAERKVERGDLLAAPDFRVGNFRSASPAMRDIFVHFDDIAEAGSTILITGETGTGKEVLARTIHETGPRSKEPFVAINCGAFPDTLLESELFGYKSGAFTGADRDKPGRFARAGNGTLFLDEIGDVSPAMQVKLLRVLQERVYEPLGSIHYETAGARIIAATNAHLEEMVKAGKFREDLLYRLNVIKLEIPPLRKRREDIMLLTQYFIQRLNGKMNRQISGVSNQVLKIFFDYSWPGNIRELENVLERSMVYCRGTLIEPEHLPAHLRERTASRTSEKENESNIHDTIRNTEMQAIEDALEKCGGNRRKAAELLGIHPASLYRKLKRYSL